MSCAGWDKTAELSFEDIFSILTSNLKSQIICIGTPFDVKVAAFNSVNLTK